MKFCSLIFTLIFLASCGQTQQTTSAKISVAALTGSVNYPGGILIVARNNDTGQRVSRGLVSDQVEEIELENGNWTFLAVGWNGGANQKIFEGQTFCDFRVNRNLTGGIQDINFQLSNQRCADYYQNQAGTNTFAGQPIYNLSKGEFTRTAFASCLGIKDFLFDQGTGDPVADIQGIGLDKGCDGNNGPEAGPAGAFRISIPDVNGDGSSSPSRLFSECRALTNDYRNYTGINIPPSFGQTNLRIVVRVYPSMTECQSGLNPAQIHRFGGIEPGSVVGLEDNLDGYFIFHPSDPTAGEADHTAGDPVFFFAMDNGSGTGTGTAGCTDEEKLRLPFASVEITDNGKEFRICSEAQWNNIADSAGAGCAIDGTNPMEVIDSSTAQAGYDGNCEPHARYELRDDIDFGSVNSSILGFRGNLEGNGHTLSNFSQALFDVITGNSLSPDTISIRDLTIDGANLSGDIANMGILVREITASTVAKEVSITGISVLNSSITTGTGGADGVGGLIGKIDQTGAVAGDNVFIRENWIRDLTITFNSTVASRQIGGLIGWVEGTNLAGVTTAIAENAVGFTVNPNDDATVSFDLELDAQPITITKNAGANLSVSIGGLIGEASNCEVRQGNYATSIMNVDGSNSGIGGLVGMISTGATNTKIENSYATLDFNPTSAATLENVGGILGSATNTTASVLKLIGVHGEVYIASEASPNPNTVNKLGGILGNYAYSNVTLPLLIENSKGVMDTYIDGNMQGGIVGNLNCGAGCTPAQGVKGSIAMGTIGDGSTGAGVNSATGASQRGGIFGNGEYVDTRFMTVDMFIEGSSQIGSAFGYAKESRVEEFFGDTSLQAHTGEIGGIIGHLERVGAGGYFTSHAKVIFDMSIGSNITDAATNGVGTIYGTTTNMNLNTFHTVDIIALQQGTVFDSNTDTITLTNCGITGASCDGSELQDIAAGDADCTGVPGGRFTLADVDSTGGNICELTFYAASFPFAGELNGAVVENYRAGSIFEPYILDTPAKWNSIGDDFYLMGKSFEIPPAGLNFGGSGMTNSIGTTNDFRGVIFGEGTISNATYTPSGTGQHAPIKRTNGASIGLRGLPLKFDNIHITCPSPGASTCAGIVGWATGSNIFVEVTNSSVDNSANNNDIVGGIIGRSFIDTELSNSSFQGSILSGGAHTGGLVGQISPNSAPNPMKIQESFFKGSIDSSGANTGGLVGSTSSNGGVEIQRSFADLSKLIGGSTYVGGILGIRKSTVNVNINSSYAWIDIDDLDSGATNDFVGVNKALIVGTCEDAGGQTIVTNSYGHVANATVAGGFTSIGIYSSGSGSASNSAYVGTGAANNGNFPHAYQASDFNDLDVSGPLGSEFEIDPDTGRLVLKWQLPEN